MRFLILPGKDEARDADLLLLDFEARLLLFVCTHVQLAAFALGTFHALFVAMMSVPVSGKDDAGGNEDCQKQQSGNWLGNRAIHGGSPGHEAARIVRQYFRKSGKCEVMHGKREGPPHHT